MTLKHVRPATINSTKLFAFVLIAVGIAVIACEGMLPRPPMAALIAWTGGFVLLALERGTTKQRRQLTRLPSTPGGQVTSHRRHPRDQGSLSH